MRTRPQIKATALANFRGIYWKAVGTNMVMMVAMSAAAGLPSSLGTSIYTSTDAEYAVVLLSIVGMILSLSFYVPMAFYGMTVYFGDAGNCNIGTVFNNGFAKFLRNIGSMLLVWLCTIAWGLLLIVPGIIKFFSYSMTPYILADCPDVKAPDAVTISKRMMKGHKWEFFVFQLSFIGWFILNFYLTCGILGIFYVYPYYQAAKAGYYVELKKKSIMDGIVTAEQFGGGSLDDMSTVSLDYMSDPYMYGQPMQMQQPMPAQQPMQMQQPMPAQQPMSVQQPMQMQQPMSVQQPMPAQQYMPETQQMPPAAEQSGLAGNNAAGTVSAAAENVQQPSADDPYAAFKPQNQSPAYDLKDDF